MRLIITGASGWLAREIAHQAKEEGLTVVGFSRSVIEQESPFDFVLDAGEISNFSLDSDDILVHCAFSRASDYEALYESISYSRTAFSSARKAGICGILNISSQSVYGPNGGRAKEDYPLCPTYPYALAKATSEELLAGIIEGGQDQSIAYSNIRLASLIGRSNDTVPKNILYKFAENALQGTPISIVGGSQRFSFLNIRDAAKAILMLCQVGSRNWQAAFNLGSGRQVSIVEMAETVNHVVVDRYSQAPVPLVIDQKMNVSPVDSGMNCDLLFETLGWRPEITFEQTVIETVEYCAKSRVE